VPDIKIFSPDALGKPLGQYSQITRVKASEFVFIAGQVGASPDGKVGEDFDAQCGLVYANIETALKSVGGGWGNVVEFTTYLVHSLPNGAYPPNTLLMVDRLVQEPFLIEVQTIAAL
jgi:enamine deaminase RidA (YjgF/YER057c/UK114 family)